MEDSFLENINFENRELIEQYESARREKALHLDSSWQKFFETLSVGDKALLEKKESPVQPSTHEDQKARILLLINYFRTFGYLFANVNPLEEKREFDLHPVLQKFGFSKSDMQEDFPTCGLLAKEIAPLREIVAALQMIYSSRIGIEFYPFTPQEVSNWVEEYLEPLKGDIPLTDQQKKEAFEKLVQAEIFETFLHTKFVGQKRFSLEGAETLICMLSAIIEKAAQNGGREFDIGMSHRGRLNVLANIFMKPLSAIMKEFHDLEIGAIEGSGDVKYHKGFKSTIETKAQMPSKLFMASNPSHLESVDPVLSGYTRARQDETGKENVLPILIHGDSALSGQGVVYESLQLSRLNGYSIGGAVHIVLNNHIGFTTLPKDSRSTPFCTDIAKTFELPVFHVNAEDVESAVFAALLALEIRNRFQIDVFIDLNCYRKYGHNESDEPAFTQPHLYEAIRKKRGILEIYSEKLMQENVLTLDAIKEAKESFRKKLQEAFDEVHHKKESTHYEDETSFSIKRHQSLMRSSDTNVDKDLLIEIGKKISRVPEHFTLHPRLKKNVEARFQELTEKGSHYKVDWAFAEALAFGSLLLQKCPLRLIGQDSRRGTFSQRHAVWIDSRTEECYVPLEHLDESQAHFEVYDSPLSEFAALGFEYGYSLAIPKTLVLWEAQFGDFANGAQVIIDQYIAAGESKWSAKSNLTLLLPHGYEGQGPEHSSGRMERFLDLSAEDNLIVAAPTTPSQYFHLLRRQAESSELKKPLIVFTPKGLLRHDACVSSIEEIAASHFENIIDEKISFEKIEAVLLCQGRIYYDLVHARAKREFPIIRMEQLYPFDIQKFVEIISRYQHIKDFIWVQEEPENAGAWRYIREKIEAHLPRGAKLHYIGRVETASPAVGSHELHAKEHAIIIESIFRRKYES